MKMWIFPAVLLLLLLSPANVDALSAVSASVPAPSVEQAKASLNPMAPSAVKQYLDRLSSINTLRVFEGKNDQLKSSSIGSGQPIIAKGCDYSVSATALFKTRLQEQKRTVYLGGVRSVDARGLRLKVDATNVATGDELWLLAPRVPRAFGPFKAGDFRSGGIWLPYVSGDTAVLMLKTSRAELPDVSVVRVSHFFTVPGKQDEPEDCYGPIACEYPSEVYELGASVGLGMSTLPGGDTMCWTGTLINNQNTSALEPYFITASHCVRSASTGLFYEGFQVFWDFRSTQCLVDDSEDVDSLPTSTVKSILASDSFLDAALLELNSVPSGNWGRVYCGWDATPVAAGTAVTAVHHPQGMDLSVARGAVNSVGFQVPELNQGNLLKVDWTESLLTFGSSGCGLFYSDQYGYYLIGMHSSSPSNQTCQTVQPWGAAASFSEFFPQIELYLTQTDTACPARVAFKSDPASLAGLRQFRDRALEPYALGRVAVCSYYLAAPYVGRYVSEHPAACEFFRYAVAPIATFGRFMP